MFPLTLTGYVAVDGVCYFDHGEHHVPAFQPVEREFHATVDCLQLQCCNSNN